MPTRATALAAALVAGGSLLAGCGGAGNPYALPSYDASVAHAQARSQPAASDHPSSPTPAMTPFATPPPAVRYRPADAWGQGAWVERGRIQAGSPEQRAAVTAMTKYMSLRVQLSNTWQVDEPALAQVASGEAVTTARDRAELQRSRGWRSVGRFIINVSSVKVSGSHADVTGCHFDATSEIDQNGGVVVGPPGGVRVTMQLQRTGATWRVVDWPVTPAPACDWRH